MADFNEHQQPAMNQMIFKLNLPVETVSVYLLCCGLSDAGKTLTLANLLEVWNSTRDNLEGGLAVLEEKNIVKPFLSDDSDNRVYKLVDPHRWRMV